MSLKESRQIEIGLGMRYTKEYEKLCLHYRLTLFRSDTSIEGILATDIFTLNAAFGATIEDQVVSTLNQMREVWDPDEKYR